jgi:hypothetical protein
MNPQDVKKGATTFSITTLRIMTFSITTLFIMTFTIRTISIIAFLQHSA